MENFSIFGGQYDFMKKIIFTLLALASTTSFAQENDYRNWGVVNFNQKINDQFSFQSDIQYRTWEDLDQLNQLLIRGGVGYNLTPNNNTVLLGYAYILTRNPDGEGGYNSFGENRIYQQFNTKHAYSRINLNHRFRFEERLMNDDIFYRFRYQFNVTVPINNAKMQENTLYAKVSNELFLNTIKKNDFDRDRLSFSLGYMFNPHVSLEAGYMKQYVKHVQTNHLLISLSFNNLLNKKPS
jgi:hypothetical protein